MNLKKEDIGKELFNDINYVKVCYENVHGYISFIENKIYRKFKIE